MNKPQHISHFAQEWKKFKRALTKSKDFFNPFAWIIRLIQAVGYDLRETTGLRWRPIVPVSGISLVFLTSGSYFWKLRSELIFPQWCDTENPAKARPFCGWIYFHDTLVLFFTIMITFYYFHASIQSPGILISKKIKRECVERNHIFRWIAEDDNERLLLSFGESQQVNETELRKLGIHYHPSPYSSFCDKCDSIRPPRCHHCRICDQCILQFDHHCIWLNNCVGYNNVRPFLLTILYLTLGCWYGVVIMYKPFYEPLQELLRKHGGLFSYIQKYLADELIDEKGLFDFPTFQDLKEVMFDSEKSMPVQAVIDIVFPFLLAVGSTLSIFLGTHIKYVLTAQTTLEHRVLLAHQYDTVMRKLMTKSYPSSKENDWVNPFDQGSYYRNWVQIMGDNWLYLFLPIRVTPPVPFITPNLLKKES